MPRDMFQSQPQFASVICLVESLSCFVSEFSGSPKQNHMKICFGCVVSLVFRPIMWIALIGNPKLFPCVDDMGCLHHHCRYPYNQAYLWMKICEKLGMVQWCNNTCSMMQKDVKLMQDQNKRHYGHVHVFHHFPDRLPIIQYETSCLSVTLFHTHIEVFLYTVTHIW